MSELAQCIDQQLTPPPTHEEASRADFMDTLSADHVEVDTSARIYPPEHIGVPSTVGDMQVGVVAEIAVLDHMSDTDRTYRHAAVLRVENKAGRIAFALQGLTPGENGTMHRTTKPAVRIGGGQQRTVIGRHPNFNQVEQGIAVTGEDLWDGVKLGSDVSRRHIAMSTPKEDTLDIEDMSLNGTRITAHYVSHEPVHIEVEPKSRNEVLFAPVHDTEIMNETETDAHLQAVLDGTFEGSIEQADMRRHENGRARVTDFSEKEAARAVDVAKHHNKYVRDLLETHAPHVPSADLPAIIRTNEKLRVALGECFLQTFDATSGHLPENVVRSHSKSAGHLGYRDVERQLGTKITSREYTVMLALAMLDGTFDPVAAGVNPIQYNSVSAPTKGGQHRLAAKLLLYSHL